jgi:hypothetical protein
MYRIYSTAIHQGKYREIKSTRYPKLPLLSYNSSSHKFIGTQLSMLSSRRPIPLSSTKRNINIIRLIELLNTRSINFFGQTFIKLFSSSK